MAAARPSFLAQPTVKNVHVYRNGDGFFAGRKFVINERRISTFEAFLREVTHGVAPAFGAVRNIYTPQQGHRVRQLQQLATGQQYVAAGRERFKKLDYFQIGVKKNKTVPKDIQIRPVAHSRIIASARFRRPIQEPCTICVIANGDLLNPAVRLLIPKKILRQWEQVLGMITEKVNLRTGAVRKLHTLDGRSISDGTELENGSFYVAVGSDKFKRLPYSELLFNKSFPRRSNGSKAASLPPIPGSKKSKENGDRHVSSTGATSDIYPVTSPHLIKGKGKKEQLATGEEAVFQVKPVKVKHNKNGPGSSKMIPGIEDSIFKAYEERTETLGAVEVQEDEGTLVELPIDQRPAETVDEEEDPQDLLTEEDIDQQNRDLLNKEQEPHQDLFCNEGEIDNLYQEANPEIPLDEEVNGEDSESYQVGKENPENEEEDFGQEKESHGEDKNFSQTEDIYSAEDLHQEKEIISKAAGDLLDENGKEKKIISTEGHTKDGDHMNGTLALTKTAERIPSSSETDSKETIPVTSEHAVMAQ
ncbi:doublecortin domain-containing protein 2 isoform X1 [Callorhinchus milii]|uniref:Doublecortin domain-containing protein 2 n=1 Tax=Callorhinchus milii TaxID=7868 RepID=V9KRZ1_CALMI|nr:doublecortin domain-containing protein 2 isoform X1 [Callorhinchus milii]